MEYIIAFTITIFGIYECQKERKSFWWYLLFIQPIIILAALRSINVGYDTHIYVFPEFEDAVHSKSIKRYLIRYYANGYLLVNYGVSRLTNNVHVYLYVIHSIMYIPVLYALYRFRRVLSVWVGIFIFCSIFYGESLNLTRQSMALSMDTLAFSYLLNKKWLKVALFTFAGYEFHHSALFYVFVILLFYLIISYHQYFNKSLNKTLIILGVVIVLSSLSILFEAFLYFDLVDERYASYTDENKFGTNIPISQLALYFINLFIFYSVNMKIRGKIKTVTEYILIISFVLCFSALISTYAIRIMMYFGYLTIILFPLLYGKKLPTLSVFHLAFLVFYWFMTIVVAKLSDVYPYEFYFE